MVFSHQPVHGKFKKLISTKILSEPTRADDFYYCLFFLGWGFLLAGGDLKVLFVNWWKSTNDGQEPWEDLIPWEKAKFDETKRKKPAIHKRMIFFMITPLSRRVPNVIEKRWGKVRVCLAVNNPHLQAGSRIKNRTGM